MPCPYASQNPFPFARGKDRSDEVETLDEVGDGGDPSTATNQSSEKNHPATTNKEKPKWLDYQP